MGVAAGVCLCAHAMRGITLPAALFRGTIRDVCVCVSLHTALGQTAHIMVDQPELLQLAGFGVFADVAGLIAAAAAAAAAVCLGHSACHLWLLHGCAAGHSATPRHTTTHTHRWGGLVWRVGGVGGNAPHPSVVHSIQRSTAQSCELMSMGPELISICIPIQSWKHRMSLSEPPEPAYR